jgi:hypothetical protein
MAATTSTDDGKSTGGLIGVLAALARTYVGHLDSKEVPLSDTDVLVLAARKVAFEGGEILVARNPPTETPIPEFARDQQGRLPDLSLSYVVAAALAIMRARDAQQARRQAAVATAPAAIEVVGHATDIAGLRNAARAQVYTTASSASTATGLVVARRTGGCGCGCGGGGGCGRTDPVPQPVPCYDPCAGGLAPVPSPHDPCVARTQPCSCAGCVTNALSTASSTGLFSISAGTQLRLKDCASQLVCALLDQLAAKMCTGSSLSSSSSSTVALCKALACARDAICPPVAPCLPPATPCLPCNYAVEISQLGRSQ